MNNIMLQKLLVYLLCVSFVKSTTPATTTQDPADAIQSVTSFEYQCDIGADIISFQRNQANIPSSLEIKVFDFQTNDSNNHNSVYCGNQSPKEDGLKVTLTCSAKKKVLVIVQPKGTADKDVVLGGHHIKLFELSCNDSSTITYTVKTHPEINLPTAIPAGTPSYGASGISLVTDKKEYAIGETMAITITKKNSQLSILPVRCSASDGGRTNLEIWSEKSCNTAHEELIGKSWSNNAGNYTIQVYAFRFKKSHTLLISCQIKVCASPNAQECTGPETCNSRRRKRAAPSKDGDITVSKKLYIKDLPYEVSLSGSDALNRPLSYSVLISIFISICMSTIKH